jgi:hypothetical protein
MVIEGPLAWISTDQVPPNMGAIPGAGVPWFLT